MTNIAEGMRRLLNIMENAQPQMDPSLVKFIRDYPNEVSDTEEEAMQKIRREAEETGSSFAWGIARLPDGRFISSFPRHLQRWGLPIIKQGRSQDL